MEWKSIMRGARPPFWRVAFQWLSVPLALEAGLAAIAWYGLRLQSLIFIPVFGVAVTGILAAFVIFLHRSGYMSFRLLTALGLEGGPPWRRPEPCIMSSTDNWTTSRTSGRKRPSGSAARRAVRTSPYAGRHGRRARINGGVAKGLGGASAEALRASR